MNLTKFEELGIAAFYFVYESDFKESVKTLRGIVDKKTVEKELFYLLSMIMTVALELSLGEKQFKEAFDTFLAAWIYHSEEKDMYGCTEKEFFVRAEKYTSDFGKKDLKDVIFALGKSFAGFCGSSEDILIIMVGNANVSALWSTAEKMIKSVK